MSSIVAVRSDLESVQHQDTLALVWNTGSMTMIRSLFISGTTAAEYECDLCHVECWIPRIFIMSVCISSRIGVVVCQADRLCPIPTMR